MGSSITKNIQLKKEVNRDKEIVEFYIEGLEELTNIYDDIELINMISNFMNSEI